MDPAKLKRIYRTTASGRTVVDVHALVKREAVQKLVVDAERLAREAAFKDAARARERRESWSELF